MDRLLTFLVAFSIFVSIPFLKVFSPIAVYPFLGMEISNMTTRCLAVTGGVVLVSAAEYASQAGL